MLSVEKFSPWYAITLIISKQPDLFRHINIDRSYSGFRCRSAHLPINLGKMTDRSVQLTEMGVS